MKIWNDIDKFNGKRPVVTIGIFDGVHRGHKFLLEQLKTKAEELEGESVVVTLWPHPRAVLGKDLANLRYLTNIDEKSIMLENEGIDHLVIIPFTSEFASLESCNFVDEFLVKKLGIVHLLVGYNHRFGKDRKGDFESLQACGKNYGFEVSRVDPFGEKGEKISSSVIRELMLDGKLDKAAEYLGYDYFLLGVVEEGNKIGRQIGFPTANIKIKDPNKLLPAIGVYAVHLSCEGKLYRGMMNIGYRPTVENEIQKKTIEVHLFDFNDDLYNKKVAVAFRARMRDEQKFESIEKLKEQLVKDRENAIELLEGIV